MSLCVLVHTFHNVLNFPSLLLMNKNMGTLWNLLSQYSVLGEQHLAGWPCAVLVPRLPQQPHLCVVLHLCQTGVGKGIICHHPAVGPCVSIIITASQYPMDTVCLGGRIGKQEGAIAGLQHCSHAHLKDNTKNH